MSSHINQDNTIPNLEIVEHTHMEVGYRISLGSLTIPADITIIYKVGWQNIYLDSRLVETPLGARDKQRQFTIKNCKDQ